MSVYDRQHSSKMMVYKKYYWQRNKSSKKNNPERVAGEENVARGEGGGNVNQMRNSLSAAFRQGGVGEWSELPVTFNTAICNLMTKRTRSGERARHELHANCSARFSKILLRRKRCPGKRGHSLLQTRCEMRGWFCGFKPPSNRLLIAYFNGKLFRNVVCVQVIGFLQFNTTPKKQISARPCCERDDSSTTWMFLENCTFSLKLYDGTE